jgi:hypothetical protein
MVQKSQMLMGTENSVYKGRSKKIKTDKSMAEPLKDKVIFSQTTPQSCHF